MLTQHPATQQAAPRLAWRHGQPSPGSRTLPAEVAVALSYGGATQAVMMATPADLEDFALGFSLAEAIIRDPAEIIAIERADLPLGIELRMTLADQPADRLWRRRRAMAGPVGCGLCGVESLGQALRPLPCLPPGPALDAAALHQAMLALPARQTLNQASHALHAAAFWTPGAGLLALREDVGRHNALDKLRGALARQGVPMAGRRRAADQPRLGGAGAEAGPGRLPAAGRGLRPHRAGRRHGRGRRHHPGRGGAAGRLRGIHPPRAPGLSPGLTSKPLASAPRPVHPGAA